MNALTIQELRLKHAQLAHQAEKLRQEQRGLPVLSSRAQTLGHRIRDVQARADDYEAILAAIELNETKESRKTA